MLNISFEFNSTHFLLCKSVIYAQRLLKRTTDYGKNNYICQNNKDFG